MTIKLTAKGVETNGHLMKPTPTKEAVAKQLKAMLFGIYDV